MPSTFIARAALAVIVGLSSSCDLLAPTSYERERRDLESAIKRWDSAKIMNYDAQVQRDCYCGFAQEPVVVRVRSDEVMDAYFARSGENVPSAYAGLFPSVRGLFRVVQDAIDREVDELRVEYHPELGYPTFIEVDPRRLTSDDEYTVEVHFLRLR
jgi:hypothetical protein